MAIPKSFPLHFPNLTRVNNLDGTDTAIEDFKIYIKQFLPLIILGNFPNAKDLLTTSDLLCTQPGALPIQRVLWIKDVDILAAIKPQVDAAIIAGFPDKEYTHDNIRALTIEPTSGKAAYLIFVDPSLSPEPKDKRKSISTFQMQRAFNAAITITPDTSNT